jgi:hypothetical protein
VNFENVKGKYLSLEEIRKLRDTYSFYDMGGRISPEMMPVINRLFEEVFRYCHEKNSAQLTFSRHCVKTDTEQKENGETNSSRKIKKISELQNDEIALLVDTDNISFKNRTIVKRENKMFLISNGKNCSIDQWPNVENYIVESIGFLQAASPEEERKNAVE